MSAASPNENKIKHLEFIQGVINRLSTNSFLLKGWSVVLVAALLGLGTYEHHSNLSILALVPVFVLWGLDAYFLEQERLFRALYDHVRKIENEEVDFSMSLEPVIPDGKGWFSAAISRTLITFHFALVFAIILVSVLQALGDC